MRNLLLTILALWGSTTIAQNKQLIYGVEEIPQALLLNPGSKVPQKMHFGVPFLSQLHLNIGSSGVSAYDIFGQSNVDINTRIRNKIFEMKNTDFFTATQQLELINFGWRAKNEIYFSGGLYQEFDFIFYFPRDLAILAWEGNRDYLDYEFDLGELNTTGDLMTVYHFGANKQITKKLTVGLRAKLYSSMFSYRSTNNSGTFVTRLGDGTVNIYEHTVQNANVTVETSGYASLRELDGASQVTSEILGRAFFGGNLGIGVDLGATYDINNNWTVSGSLLDLGAVFHSKDVETYQATGTYTLNGIELIFPPLSDGESTFPYYDNLEDEIEREIPIDTLHNGYTQMRPLKVNGGLTYKFGKAVGRGGDCDCRNGGGGVDRNQSVGLQVYSIFRPKLPQTAGTLFYYRRLTEFVSAKATYTVDPYSYSNVGLGVTADIGKFNFYVAADNLLRYGNLAKAKSVSLQLGLNIKIDEE
ncbi:hypothetical protein ATE92_1612 [Ulvibacter sp. MAR_2010_11]|uniref:DUF5723 family protein n=1 Tax=Ulvibacter sp. MAR_2010_11 TaxID=1250229 RepID=UPI000C2CBF35|nr:DUF5723 family protein [Ulvibacter sp. MAR_2010_11]PKA83457.1 hypothetical protein ATE92_1612 [Ulvibacter sp. MAR_2010_11]